MIYVITIGAFIAAALILLAAYSLFSPQNSQVVADRLSRLRNADRGLGKTPLRGVWKARIDDAAESEIRNPQSAILNQIIQPIGRMFGRMSASTSGHLRRRLIMAGYFGDNAVVTYTGIRVLMAATLPLAVFLIPSSISKLIFLFPVLALLGLVVPSLLLSSRISRRQLVIRNSLADALDLMVSCVEAGLSLNAALARVADELNQVHPDLTAEFKITGLELRAGTTREQALRNLGKRSGVKDLKSFTAMLIQTDKFGTSIARALRVFSDTLRTKRRQRAEEAAAKTTIKLVFPLVFFIFPAILTVLLGPGIIQVVEVLKPAMGQ